MKTPEVLGTGRSMEGQKPRRQFVLSDSSAIEALTRPLKPHPVLGGNERTVFELSRSHINQEDALFIQKFFVEPRSARNQKVPSRGNPVVGIVNSLHQLNVQKREGILSLEEYQQLRVPLLIQKRRAMREMRRTGDNRSNRGSLRETTVFSFHPVSKSEERVKKPRDAGSQRIGQLQEQLAVLKQERKAKRMSRKEYVSARAHIAAELHRVEFERGSKILLPRYSRKRAWLGRP